MGTNLMRTTTYLDKDLLLLAKMQAMKRNTSVYEIINNWLLKGAGSVVVGSKIIAGNKKFDDVVKTKPLKLKGKLNREEIYGWL